MVLLSYSSQRRRTSRGGGSRSEWGKRSYRDCGASTSVHSNANYPRQSVLQLDTLLRVGSGGGYDPSGCWLLFLLLLMFSNVSEECPTGCQCKWKSGKESVSCFRASLTKIPVGLDSGTQVLNMSGNSIKSLPGHVFLSLNLLNLQKIYLSDCELVSLHPLVFSKLTNLVELDLSSNGLELIPSHTFSEIPELRELKVNSNPISRLSNNAFAPLRRLVRLELTSCQLTIIEPWAFRDLRSLEWLLLDSNKLRVIMPLFPLQSLHGLKLSGNPWNCSCALKPLRDWMLRNNIPFEGVPPTCQEPRRLGGKSWDRLSLDDFACLPKLQASTEEERIQRVIEGHNTTFICRLEATADTHVTWLAGSRGVTLTNGSSWSVGGGGVMLMTTTNWKADNNMERRIEEEESENGILDRSLGIKISILTVTRATARDAGLYTCRGESQAGSVSTNFSLIVLQNKAENTTGRLLFTGTLAAALLTVLACLLLFCVCLVGRHRRTMTIALSMRNTTNSTTPPSNATHTVVNHQMDKIELNHFGNMNQNGGNGLPPSIHPHHQHNHTNNLSSPNPNSSHIIRRSSERITRDYKALPTVDPDEHDQSSSPSQQQLSPSQKQLSLDGPSLLHGDRNKITTNTTITTSSSSPSTNFGFNLREPQQQQQRQGTSCRENKFPDLIDEKMSLSTTTSSSDFDFVSLPRPNRNHDIRSSNYFHRRESQSPLLSSSHNNSYDNSVDTLAYSTTSSTSCLPHGQQPHYHRLSMPSSPLHGGDQQEFSTSYDYHAAQLLEKFLEEYRILQLELMQMSASLNQQPNQETNVNLPRNDSSTSSHQSQQQQQQHQQQLKSILKTTHNNNYMS